MQEFENFVRMQKFKEMEDRDIFIKNELGKACFQHHTVYRDFKDLTRRTASDKILSFKALNIAKNPKYDRYKRNFASMAYIF